MRPYWPSDTSKAKNGGKEGMKKHKSRMRFKMTNLFDLILFVR